VERDAPRQKPSARRLRFRTGILDVGVDCLIEKPSDLIEGSALQCQIEIQAKRLPPVAASAGNA
jgi:hypothetical protein